MIKHSHNILARTARGQTKCVGNGTNWFKQYQTTSIGNET